VLLAARFLFQDAPMNAQPLSPAAVLGSELTDALDRSLETSLGSLISLRAAVHAYAIHSKKRGVPLDAVIRSAARMLAEAEEDRVTDFIPSPARDSELAKQLRQWCKDGYADGD
jgi:hypothetical protein